MILVRRTAIVNPLVAVEFFGNVRKIHNRNIQKVAPRLARGVHNLIILYERTDKVERFFELRVMLGCGLVRNMEHAFFRNVLIL